MQFNIDKFIDFKSTASIWAGPFMEAMSLMKLKVCEGR